VKRQERNEILTRHRISRHPLPTLLYFLFSPPHIFNFSANPHLAHCQAAQANAETKACQRAKFSFAHKTGNKIICIFDKIVQTD